MKKTLLILILLIGGCSYSQTITHPKGTQKSLATISPGKEYHYYDDGGATSNYTVLTNSTITIYPDKEGHFTSLSCNLFEINSDCRMYVFDGNHPGAAILKYIDVHSGNPANTFRAGEVLTASSDNPSGALTIRFINTKHRETLAGWDFTVTCSKNASAPLPITTQDCSGAIKVCSDSAITTKSSGSGFQELPGPHYWNTILNYGGNGENQSNWYKFEVATPGNIEFLIKPHSHTDFDWTLWGPYSSHQCPAWTGDKGSRISAGDGNNSVSGITGLSKRAMDYSEGSSGDGFVAPLQVNAGEHYVLMIDDWSGKNTTFDLKWSFLNGASLECAADEEPPIIPDSVDITIEKHEDPCYKKTPILKTKSTPETASLLGSIELTVSGGTAPFTYKWTDAKGTIISSENRLNGIYGGNYNLVLTDANGCYVSEEVRVEVKSPFSSLDVEPKIKADLSSDQKFVTVSYPGAFEYKIENMNRETVITGHSVDSDEVEITRLPPGTYRVSLIYKKIKQYTEFVKD